MKGRTCLRWLLIGIAALTLAGCGMLGKGIEGTGGLIQKAGRTVRNIG